jgi:inner membrane protein
MDAVTHLALGACTAELLLPERLGKKRLIWGALAQALPDMDTLPRYGCRQTNPCWSIAA